MTQENEQIRYPLVLKAVSESLWAILPEKLTDICHLLAVRASGSHIAASEIAEIVAARSTRQQSMRQNIAVVPVLGTLSHRASMMSEMSGGTSLQKLSGQLTALANDPSVGTIVLDIDSPGGEVSGTPEMAAQIREIRQSKNVVAVANTLAASAAYWIGSQASEFVVSPSALVGSIGVMSAHENLSGALANQGIDVTIISAGKYKTEGLPFGPLDDEARAYVQARVDRVYAQFTADVATGRGVAASRVRNGFGEGRVVSAEDAVQMGMADRIDTLDGVLAGLVSGESVGRSAKAEIGEVRTVAESEHVFDVAETEPSKELPEDIRRRLRVYS